MHLIIQYIFQLNLYFIILPKMNIKMHFIRDSYRCIRLKDAYSENSVIS